MHRISSKTKIRTDVPTIIDDQVGAVRPTDSIKQSDKQTKASILSCLILVRDIVLNVFYGYVHLVC